MALEIVAKKQCLAPPPPPPTCLLLGGWIDVSVVWCSQPGGHRGHLAHAGHRDAAEGAQHVGLHTGRRLEHEDAAGTQQVHRHLGAQHRQGHN